MAYETLCYYSQRDMTFRFVSNVDGNDFNEAGLLHHGKQGEPPIPSNSTAR